MKRLLCIVTALLLGTGLPAQKRIEKIPDLLPIKESYLLSGKLDSSQYLYFLNGILKEQFDARRKTLNNLLTSKEALLSHRTEIKKSYLDLLGPFPEKTPLNPLITGKIQKAGYSIEKVAFESRPQHHVTALLYIPDGNGPFPAILHMPGHSYTAKGRDYYQRIGRYFALNGFVVLQVDPVAQGERCQICQDGMGKYSDFRKTPMEQSTTGQHELYNEKLMLLGSGVVAWEAWDNIRSIDYLCTRREVDTGRIGITGLSGGGTQTTYLAPLDCRIKVAGPGSYIATTEEKYKTIGSQDGCQQLWSEGKLGIEEQDFLFMASPMPLIILSTYGDFFSYRGSLRAVDELRKIYSALGYEGRIRQFAMPGEHGMPYRSIREDVKWMSWWLRGDSSHIINDTLENDFLQLEDTWVTSTGQVLSYFKNEKSILDYSVELMEKLRPSRMKFLSEATETGLRNKVTELTGIGDITGISGGEYKGSFMWQDLKIEKHLINRDRGLGLPALVIRPGGNKTGKVNAIILSGCFGKMKELDNNLALIRNKLKAGYIVMIVDITNTGELRTPEEGRDMSYEFSVAKMPVYAGKTLLGYRAEDLSIAKNYLKNLIGTKKIELLASEQTGPPAIHAVFLDREFSKLYLKNSLHSWEEIVKTHFTPDNIGIIVPGVLKFYDLPDLLKHLKKNTAEIIN